MRAPVLIMVLFVGCVGDSSGSDGGADAVSDVTQEVAQDAAQDVAPIESGADGSSDGGSDACPYPPTSIAAGCTGQDIACLTQTQIACQTPSSCSNLSGERQLLCGSVADCDGGHACCTTATISTSGCPTVITLNGQLTNIGTQCTASATKACAVNALQVCLTSAECVTGTCEGAVFDVNGQQVVKLGICQ